MNGNGASSKQQSQCARTAFVIERFVLEREALCLVVQSCLAEFQCVELGCVDEALSNRWEGKGVEIAVAGGLDCRTDGLHELERLCKGLRPARVVAIVDRPEFTWMRRAAAVGAAGFISRMAGRKEFCRALRLVLAGEVCIPGGDLDRAPVLAPTAPGGIEAQLSPRQRQVLDLLVEGLSSREMAAAMGLRISTVRNHLQAVLKAMKVHTRTQAVLAAVRSKRSDPRE